MEIHQRSADVMEGKSPINMDLGLTPAGVINLWLDEYFLRLKWQSYERSARDATADELVAAYLAHRKGPENEFSLMIHWLHLVSNPRHFGKDGRGNPKPFLKVALDMTSSLEKVMENYSRRDNSSDLVRALENVRDDLKISLLAVCCCSGKFQMASEFYVTILNEGRPTEIPPGLLECIESKTAYDATKDLERLRRSAKLFLGNLNRRLPSPAIVKMAEDLLSGDVESQQSEDVNVNDFDIPMSDKVHLPDRLQQLHESHLNSWVKKLSNCKPNLRCKKYEMNVREHLMRIQEDSVDRHVRNLGGRDTNDEGDATDEDGDLIFRAMDGKKECVKRRRVVESESDENVAVERNGVEYLTEDEAKATEDTDVISESQPLVIFPGRNIEGGERVPPSGSFRTSTQKELVTDTGEVLSRRLARPPLSQVQGLSPIPHHRSKNLSKGNGNLKSPSPDKRASSTKTAPNHIQDPRIVNCSVIVDKLPLIVLPPSMLSYPTSEDNASEEEEPKEKRKKTSRPRHKLFSDKILEPGTVGRSSGGLILDGPDSPTHNNSILLRNLRKEQDPNKRIFGDTYSQSRKHHKNRMPIASTDENPKNGSGKVNNFKANAPPNMASESGDSDFEALAFGARKKAKDGGRFQVLKELECFGNGAASNGAKSPRKNRSKRIRWTQEEERLLYDAVKKLGTGRWAEILSSGMFPNRTNIDLKDKWRNMENSNWLGKMEGLRTSRD